MAKKYTDEVLKELFKQYNIVWEDGKSNYLGYTTQMYCKDTEGYECMVRVSDLQRGHGVRRFYESNPYTMNNIGLWLTKNSSNIELVEGQEYVSAKAKMKFKCLDCGEIFESTWDRIHSKSGCNYCRGRSVNDTTSFATAFPELLIYLKDKNIANTFKKGSRRKLDLVCPKCGFEKTMPSTDLKRRGFSCNNCNPDYGITRGNEMYCPTQASRKKKEWKNKITFVYVVRMFKGEESFYKIGIGHKGANKRFSDRVNTTYEFDILYEYKTNLYDGIMIENELHKFHEEHSYTPNVHFKGYTECFSFVDLQFVKDFINDYNEE